MKKEMSLRISLKERVKLCVLQSVTPLATALSFCLDEEVSTERAFRILHAVVAFTMLVFTYGNACLSVLFLAWFALTLLDCKRSGLK